MAEQKGLKTKIRPINKLHCAVSAPMSSAIDADLAYQTQALAFNESRSVRTYHYPTPKNCSPFFSSSLFDTDAAIYLPYNYVATGSIAEFGWLAHPKATRLVVEAVFGLPSYNDVTFYGKLNTGTLIDAVASRSSAWTEILYSSKMPKMIDWPDIADGFWNEPFNIAYAGFDIKPDYPADRTKPFAFSIGIKVSGEQKPNTKSWSLHLMSLVVRDEIDPPGAED